MRGRWFGLGFASGVLLSFVIYYSAEHVRRPGPKIAPPSPALSNTIGPPIANLKPSELRDSFNEIHFGHKHEAIDIMEPRGTPVLAVSDGSIAKLLQSKAGGNTIYQFDGTGVYCYYYAHLDGYAPGLRDGRPVKKGEAIGYVGSTGDASPNAPHLHFGIDLISPGGKWSGGVPIDPYPLLMRAVS